MPRNRIHTAFTAEGSSFEAVARRATQRMTGFSRAAFSPAGAIAAAGALGAGVIKLTSSYLNNANELSKMSQRTGRSAEDLSGLKFAFEQADLSVDDLEKSLRRLNLRRPGASIEEVADEIQRLTTIQEKSAVAAEAFGTRLGPRMLTFLEQGSEGIERYREQSSRLGLTISQESADLAARTQDNLDTINRAFQGASTRFAASIVNWGAPIVEAFGKSIGVLPDEARAELDKTNAAILSYVDAGRAAGLSFGEAVAAGVQAGLFTRLDAIKARFARDVRLLNQAAVTVADNPQRALSLLTGSFGTAADAEENRQQQIADIENRRSGGVSAVGARGSGFSAGDAALASENRLNAIEAATQAILEQNRQVHLVEAGALEAVITRLFPDAGAILPDFADLGFHELATAITDLRSFVSSERPSDYGFSGSRNLAEAIVAAIYSTRTGGLGAPATFGGPTPHDIDQLSIQRFYDVRQNERQNAEDLSNAVANGLRVASGGGGLSFNVAELIDATKSDPLSVFIAGYADRGGANRRSAEFSFNPAGQLENEQLTNWLQVQRLRGLL